MKKFLALTCAAVLLLMIPAMGLADRMYLIPDSDTRKLTVDELWEWDYESLGYILNEIFARHGYVFQPGGKYDEYFSSLPWYTPNADSDNRRACYPKMNNTEWYNEGLVKEVRADMRAIGTTNKGGKSVWTNFSTGFDTLRGFDYCQLKGEQKLAVYSAPSEASYRGANGKALVNTNGALFAAGWEGGWLLVMYETNNGGVRVGYVDGNKIKGKVPVTEYLNFSYSDAEVNQNVQLTDDPAARYTSIVSLQAGDHVTYLTNFYNRHAWAYVETTVGGQTVRGFIPAEAIDNNTSSAEDDEIGNDANN